MKNSPLKRTKGLRRSGGPKRSQIPHGHTDGTSECLPESIRDLQAAREWMVRVTGSRKRPCAVCGSHGRTQGHHVIAQQVLKRLAIERGFSIQETEALLWDIDAGMPLCPDCHQRHELAFCRVPYALLSEANVAFARSLHMERYLDRYYPREAA